MATLEEIAEQFEEALGESTGTTIEPGTITPQGVTSSVSGKKKLSWPEIVEKINEGIGVRQNELLPEVPEGVSAQKFYRTAAQSGLMPSGLSTFTSSPFGSFRGRMGIAQNTESVASAAPVESVDAPQSVVQTQRATQSADDGSTSDSEVLDPMVNPDMHVMDLLKLALPGGGAAFIAGAKSENMYTDVSLLTPEEIDSLIDQGNLNDAQIAAIQAGIEQFNYLGQPVNEEGKVIDTDVYYQNAKDRFENHPVFGSKKTWMKPILNFLGTGDTYAPGAFTPGYQRDGTYVTDGGQKVAMGTDESFKSLADVDPVFALNVIDARGPGVLGISAENINYANRAFDRMMDNLTEQDLGVDDSGSAPGGPDISPQAGDADAPGEEDIDGIDGGDGGTSDDSGEDTLGDDGLGWGFQEGGQVAQGAEADMSNLGMINEQAAQPQQGGAVSVKDDIPREADEGDYILPYETVLLVGLKDLNRYAKEAIDLAMKNGVNLKGTDLDPTDDVPIKVSNYEYHIPKMLVPFFGGGKKYLDKIRQEGLDLRKRLEEEKQPSMQEQQPMAEAQPAPAPAQAAPAPAQAAPAPQVPMMQQGGFVDDPQKKQMQTSAAVLETDASQQAPSAYNQMQALERTRRQAQQPPMVDPMGRVVQQGFAAPQGYEDGDEVKQETMPAWASRALDPKTPVLRDETTGDIKTVRTMSINYKGKEILFPTIRLKGKELVQLSEDEALAEALKKNDYIPFNTPAEATKWAKTFSQAVNDLRGVQQGFAAPQKYALGTEPGGVPMPEAEDQIYLDTPELKEPFSEKPDPFMQKRTEPMREIEVDESGFTSDTVPAIDEPAAPQTAAPEEKATPDSQKMQEAKTIMSKFSRLHPVQMMALVAMGEARGDGIEGMRAVMHVINNRTKYGKRFGKTVPEVILAKKQFSAILPDLNDPEAYQGPQYENFMSMMNTDSGDKLYNQAKKLAEQILQGKDEDITNGATHYYNPNAIDEPSWAKGMTRTATIKSHIFFGINKKDGGFVDKVIDEAA